MDKVNKFPCAQTFLTQLSAQIDVTGGVLNLCTFFKIDRRTHLYSTHFLMLIVAPSQALLIGVFYKVVLFFLLLLVRFP